MTMIDKEHSVEGTTGAIQSEGIGPEPQLSVFVVFTSVKQTLNALEKASELAKNLGAKIVIVAAQVIPFPLPLDEPPVSFELVMRRFETMAARKLEGLHISPYLCREPCQAYQRVLNRNSPVVIGLKKRWWRTPEEKLARKLQSAGFKIIPVETE